VNATISNYFEQFYSDRKPIRDYLFISYKKILKFSFIYIDIKDRAIAFSALMTKLFKIA